MKKIKNPYITLQENSCFGCSKENVHGLKMEFYEDGEEVICKWNPQPEFQGYSNILHGGIQATLMDEIASYVVYVKMLTSGVTSKLEVRYKKPVPTNKGEILLRARLKEIKRNLAFIHIELFGSDGEKCSEADAVYYTYTQEYSKNNLGFPENPVIYEE